MRSRQMTPETAREIRMGFDDTQEEFAERIGVSVGTIRDWEQGRRPIPLMAVNFLQHLAKDLKDRAVPA